VFLGQGQGRTEAARRDFSRAWMRRRFSLDLDARFSTLIGGSNITFFAMQYSPAKT